MNHASSFPFIEPFESIEVNLNDGHSPGYDTGAKLAPSSSELVYTKLPQIWFPTTKEKRFRRSRFHWPKPVIMRGRENLL